MINQIALVSQTDQVTMAELTVVSAAVQKQLNRDVAPFWDVDGTVDSFASLEDVPLGYWPVIIKDDIQTDAAGVHLDSDSGQPFALVQISDDWPLTTSHEILEMVVDPSGNRTIATNSPKPDQGRVLILVEVCDPSENAQFGYSVNGILVSDFYTPRFFDPVAVDGVRYSFTGAITEPRQVLDGGYMSWWDPSTRHVFQMFVDNGKKKFVDRGPLPAGFGTLRSFSDRFTNDLRIKRMKKRKGLLLTSALGGKATKLDASLNARAKSLQRQIDAFVRRGK